MEQQLLIINLRPDDECTLCASGAGRRPMSEAFRFGGDPDMGLIG
jgi:hypothetical protein